jgi:hypothetical protein
MVVYDSLPRNTSACRAIPDLMRTGRLAIKGEAEATQLFSDFVVTKA